jgi:hypothetical protein
MQKSTTLLRIVVLLSVTASFVSAQTSSWVVQPEWVRAHEMFLASDAMRGRGSATPDEWIAAVYVASEFQQYGLKPGLPDGTFIQRVELVGPQVEGTARITAPQNTTFAPLEEGKDFSLQRVSGQSVSGPLQIIPAGDLATAEIRPGTIVLVSGALERRNPFVRRLFTGGVKALLRMDPSLTPEQLAKNLAQRPAANVHLPGINSAMGADINVISLTADAADRLAKLSDGTPLSVEIHARETTRYTYNAVGVLPGSESGPDAKILLLSAHLDHLGIGRPVSGDSIYNGADDDASGTTAVMELARALTAGPRLRRTVYFVCYGSEELGGLGSTYFREHSPVPLDHIAANLEFEMIGNQDPKMPKGTLLLTGWDRSNLGPTLAQHGALLGNDPYPEQHFFERSDNYPLALRGVVAHTAAGWGTPPTYHQPDDDLEHLDFDFLTKAIQSMIEPLRWLANSDFVPQWLPGKQPHGRE